MFYHSRVGLESPLAQPLRHVYLPPLFFAPFLLTCLLFGSILVAGRWTRAPRGFVATLAGDELLNRIKRLRRWRRIGHRYYLAINLISLASTPVVGLLALRGFLPRAPVFDVFLPAAALVFWANQVASSLVPWAVARRLALYCPSCRHLLGVLPDQLKAARHGECPRCHVRFLVGAPLPTSRADGRRE